MLFENVLTSSVDDITITIAKALLPNHFTLLNCGRDLYLNYYDGLHDLNFAKLPSTNPSSLGPSPLNTLSKKRKNHSHP